MAEIKHDKSMWDSVPKEEKNIEKIVRPSMTYWQDAWRRLKHNHLSMIGLYTIILLVLLAIVGPMFSSHSFSKQNLSLQGIPPVMDLYKVTDNTYVYAHREYKLIQVDPNGKVIKRIAEKKNDTEKKVRSYDIDGKKVELDYSYISAQNQAVTDGTEAEGGPQAQKFMLRIDGQEVQPDKTVFNKTYWFGSDTLGRDIFVRVLNGARISLFIAFVATSVNLVIGVLYGGISGYMGGRVDAIMMRIVDIIDTVPLILYVILLTVVFEPGLQSIVIALGSVFWDRMARIVRAQVLTLKEQEFILAARTLGASTNRIMIRHLIPNALGPIIVTMTMMIPTAIFTEAFLSFIGLGVTPPIASWGTLANDALAGLRTYSYQLFFPSMAICITMLAFNFLGDGLRDALDPRLRK